MTKIKIISKLIILAVLATTAFFYACRDQQWDESNKLSNENSGVSLLEAICEHPEGKVFYDAIMKTQLDTVLVSAGNFTVFVPKNDAWQGVDMNNTVELSAFLRNQIVYGKYLKTQPELYNSPLKMVNTKTIRYDYATDTFLGATVSSYDNVAGNGVFHITDRLFELRDNIWDFISKRSDEFKQVEYLQSINHRIMDMQRSVTIGVNHIGQPVYDTVWLNVNNFLKEVPLDNEDVLKTYIVLKDDGYDSLYEKFRKYFVYRNDAASDSLTYFNICRDFIFDGIQSLEEIDELENDFEVKVAFNDASIIEGPYELSNGRLYIVDQSNITLREKFKVVHIEGEDFVRSSGTGNVYTRYKRWASGERDIMLNCSNVHTDTIPTLDADGNPVLDAEGNPTFTTRSVTSHPEETNNRADQTNFWIEFNAQVFAIDYEIHYLAVDDNPAHSSRLADPTMACKFEMKLFVSLPGQPLLNRNPSTHEFASKIVNNWHENICFVSRDTAKYPITPDLLIPKKMMQWTLQDNNMQYLDKPVPDDLEPNLLKVDRSGILTMWLCNTPRINTAQEQGIMYLDYIRLVPIFKDEDN